MTRRDDETLIRWSDGELTPEEAAALEAEAAADAELAGRMAALRRLRSFAREAFPATPDPRDRDLACLIAGSAPRRSPLQRLAGAFSDAFEPRRAAVWAGLATAAFVGGLVLGAILEAEPRGLRVGPDGTLTDRALVQVLDTRLAAEGADGDGRSIGLTFQDGERRWCRTFRAPADGVAGLACREGDAWALRVLAPSGGPSGGPRGGGPGGPPPTAGSDTPEPVLAAVDAVILGETADAATEAKARDAGWR